MIALLLALVANAAPDASHAWLLNELGDHDGAARVGARLLDLDPDDLEAHRLYAWSRSRSEGRDTLEPLYRSWFEEDPERPAARLGLAAALLVTREDPAACEEASTLLDGLPDEPVARYWGGRVRAFGTRCGWDLEDIQQQLRSLADEYEVARSYALAARLTALDLDEDALIGLRELYEKDPPRLQQASSLWGRDAKGRMVKKAREDAIAAVEAAYESDDPTRIGWGLMLARRVDNELHARGRERLEAIAPHLVPRRPEPLVSRIAMADHKQTHESALAALDALAHEIPDDGWARSRWQDRRKARLEALGRTDEAYEALRDAARAAPDTAWLQNEFAYAAAQRGEDLEEALVAIDRALTVLGERRWDPARQGHEDWARGWRRHAANYQDTRGWLLHRLGRGEEALEALELTARSVEEPSAVHHAHLGLVLLGQGEERAAFEHLLLAEVAGISEKALAHEARTALEALWPEHGLWHPDGLDGFVQVQKQSSSKPAEKPKAHPLIGNVFPIDEVTRIRGGTLSLASVEGIRLVDLWATPPCQHG